ncbi:MAG: DNA cytosine methyltransferase [Pseudomonadota bacterium]|nr:DNA cytosine methyltransferase [Pseudomonadota bacterium]
MTAAFPPKQLIIGLDDELIIDNFAGGGGASSGIEMATGRHVDIAINHDPEAVALHMANHPQTKHFCESVWDIDPVEVCHGRPIGLAWFSPDCKHFSKAKGGKPVEKKIRGLAWIVIRWAKKVRPRIIILENVEEFKTWGPLTADNMPCPKRKGQTFQNWVKELRKLGYAVEWKELRACDYGAPTIRKRLFLIARCDGLPIVWPAPTHGKKKGLKPFKTAADCIDWSIPCPSIFERTRPLAGNTCRRIAKGIMRYVVNNPKPFIVSYYGQKKDEFRGSSMNEPLRTQTAENRFGLVSPTITRIGQTGGNGKNCSSVTEPLTTITSKAEHLLVMPTMIQTGYGEREGQSPRSLDLNKPLGTVVAQGQKHALVSSFMAKHYSGVVGQESDKPLGTITSIDHHSLVSAHVQRDFGASIGSSASEPIGTITGSGNGKASIVASKLTKCGHDTEEPSHIEEVRTFLIKYYGNEKDGVSPIDPMPTVTTKDRIGLVMVHGEPYQIVDIGMRMLEPRELYRAQGFPDSYRISIPFNGKLLSKSAQVRMCGNSVSPVMAKVLVSANYHPMRQQEATA